VEALSAFVFVGFMGAGKSTAARVAAAELGVEPLDSDREVERVLGEAIESYFDRQGEDAFRAREEEVVLELLARPDARVIALGGGALGSERVRDALREHTVVQLQIGAEEAWRRASGKGRPLARDRGRFEQLKNDRESVYEAVASAWLPPMPRDGVRRAMAALGALESAPVATRLAWAAAASGEYPVFFGRGLVGSDFFYPREGSRFVVTDQNVATAHTVPAQSQLAVPAGEEQKTLERAEEVLRFLAASGATREDVVVAVGGGVVGDLGGFCASVYQRGMRWVGIPTTVVAQVDSAYGGKTGVDLPEAKNYVGSYHHPAAVLTDPAVLETLPPEEAAAGYAEVVKTALIAGGTLWARVREGGPLDDETIWRCLRTKLAIVAEDERDSGRRQVLNLGHTVGHAIEAATGYARYRHGEAVAIGLLAALRVSGRDALRAEVQGLLEARGLPVRFEGAAVDDVLDYLARDKKRTGGHVPLVLVQAPGEVTPGHEVASGELRAAVEEVAA
jgi:shikimate kinase/3-dehydroquinate synthase